MLKGNSANTAKGRAFQIAAKELLGLHLGVSFEMDHPIAIGNPPKPHKFDLVSSDSRYIGECKNYSWTETANVPSAKMGFINEAIFYLSFVSPGTVRFVVMRRDTHPERNETLADYYHRTYRHLLNDVVLFEIDLEHRQVREIGQSSI